jgi:hypothetical protein
VTRQGQILGAVLHRIDSGCLLPITSQPIAQARLMPEVSLR